MVDYKENDKLVIGHQTLRVALQDAFRAGRLYGPKFPTATFDEYQNTVLNTTLEIINKLHKEGRIPLLESQSHARTFVVTEPHLIVNERELEEQFVTVVDIVKRYPSTQGPAQARNSIQSLLGRNAAKPYYFDGAPPTGTDTAAGSDPATDLKERKEALVRELEVVNLELELARKKRLLAMNIRMAAARTATGTASSTVSMRRTAGDYEGAED